MSIPYDQLIYGQPVSVGAAAIQRLISKKTVMTSAENRAIAAAYETYGALTGIGDFMPLVQAIKETAWFTSTRWRLAWNPAGLGATNDGAWGHDFKNPAQGIFAQYCHLLAYAIPAGYESTLEHGLIALDPRIEAVTKAGWRGSAQRWVDLSRKWATEPTYGQSIIEMANQLWGSL